MIKIPEPMKELLRGYYMAAKMMDELAHHNEIQFARKLKCGNH